MKAWLLIIFSITTITAFADEKYAPACDPGIEMSNTERERLLSRVRETATGKEIIAGFDKKYGSFKQLVLQWDLVSYSQIIRPRGNRQLASKVKKESDPASPIVCIHLTKKLPEIEHVADLSHELTHAVLLEEATLSGDSKNVEHFVRARIAGRGGEAEAFAAECKVKREILKDWDSLCAPYAKSNSEMGVQHIVDSLYNGTLSASLTGETYPIMLGKQYRNLMMKKARLESERLRQSGVR